MKSILFRRIHVHNIEWPIRLTALVVSVPYIVWRAPSILGMVLEHCTWNSCYSIQSRSLRHQPCTSPCTLMICYRNGHSPYYWIVSWWRLLAIKIQYRHYFVIPSDRSTVDRHPYHRHHNYCDHHPNCHRRPTRIHHLVDTSIQPYCYSVVVVIAFGVRLKNRVRFATHPVDSMGDISSRWSYR